MRLLNFLNENSFDLNNIKDDLMKIASQSGDKFAKSILLLDQSGILDVILPEITNLKKFKEEMSHHPEAYEDGKEGTVFDHVIAAIKTNKIADPIINLAILVHDVGKGLSYDLKDGKHSYYGHAEKSKELIDKIADRLKLSTKEREALLFAALNHMKILNAPQMKPNKILKLIDNEYWPVLKAVYYCDDACRTGLFNRSEYEQIIKNIEDIYKKHGEQKAEKVADVVDGKTIIKITGMKPGKQVGVIIKKVTDIVKKGSKEKIEDIIMRVYNEIA